MIEDPSRPRAPPKPKVGRRGSGCDDAIGSTQRAVFKTIFTRRWASLHVNHRSIAASAALIGVLTIVAKLFVAGREIAIASRFGTSGLVDSYQLALTITTWLPMMIASVTAVVVVPRLVALRTCPVEYRSFVAELNGTMLLLGLAVAALTLIAAPTAAALMASGENWQTLDLTSTLSQEMAPLAFLTVATAYFSVRLQALQRFAYSITEAVPALAIALFVLLPGELSGSTRLAFGTLIGFLLQALLLGGLTQSEDVSVGGFKVRHRSAEWRPLYRSALLMFAGQIMIALTLPIDQAFAARLGPGAVASLGYANRIIILATSLGGIVLARALLPVLSAAVATGDRELAARHARQWAWLLMGLGALGSAAAFLLSDWAVSLLFERGAFTRADSIAVAAIVRAGALQLPFYFAGLALVQWLAALGRYSTLLLIACVALALKLTMNFLLVPIFGLQGLMIATAAMYALSFAWQYYTARKS